MVGFQLGEVVEPPACGSLPGTGDPAAVGPAHLVAGSHALEFLDQRRVDREGHVLGVHGVQQRGQPALAGHLVGEVVIGQQPLADQRRAAVEDRDGGHPERALGLGGDHRNEDPAAADGDVRGVLQDVHTHQKDPVVTGQAEVGNVDLDPEVDRLVRLEIGIVGGVEILEVLVEQPATDRVVRFRDEGLIKTFPGGDGRLVAPEEGAKLEQALVGDVAHPAGERDRAVAGRQGWFDRGEGDVDQPDRLLGGGGRGRDQARRDHARHRQQCADQPKRTPPPHPPILSAAKGAKPFRQPHPAMLGRVGQRV